jgi:hypothetical protein
MWMTDRRSIIDMGRSLSYPYISQKYGITGHGSARTPGTPQTKLSNWELRRNLDRRGKRTDSSSK